MKRLAILLFILSTFSYASTPYEGHEIPEAEMVAGINGFAHRYFEQFERDDNAPARSPVDPLLLVGIADKDSRALVRGAAERTLREIIRGLQARALNTEDRTKFQTLIFNLKKLKTMEAIAALALIAKTEHARNSDRAIYVKNALVMLAQQKDFDALIDKCQEILGAETANRGILDILGERRR